MRSETQRGLALLGALLLCGGAAVAGAQESPPEAPSSLVRVRVRVPDAEVFQDRAQFVHPGFPEQQCRLGCTQMLVRLSWSLDTTVVTFSDGERDYWVSGLTVSMGYPSVGIYITPKYRPGSCEYEAVLEHERRHVEEDRRLLAEFAGRLRAALDTLQWPSYADPAVVDSVEEVRQQGIRTVQDVIDPLMEEFTAKRALSSRAVDDRDREKGVVARCARR